VDQLLVAASLLVLIGCWVLIGLRWGDIPERVATHFTLGGKPDAWGGRGVLFVIPVAATVLWLVQTFLALIPHVFNYAWEITEENAAVQYRLAARLVRVLNLYVTLVFVAIEWFALQVAAGERAGLPHIFVPAIVGLVAIFAVHFIVASKHQ